MNNHAYINGIKNEKYQCIALKLKLQDKLFFTNIRSLALLVVTNQIGKTKQYYCFVFW